MLKKLLSLVMEPVAPPSHAAQCTQPPPQRKARHSGTPIYPPVDSGIGSITVEDILGSQAELIRRTKLLAGTNDADFELRYLGVMRRLAGHVQLLPASETETHVGPGGLFRLCLELAFYSAQAAEGYVFNGRGTAEDRRREDPRWRYAAFLAGLTCEAHRCVTSMTVVDDDGRVWPAFNIPITQWIEEGNGTRYFVKWVNDAKSGPATAGLLVEKIVSTQNLQYLLEGSPRIVPTMMDAVSGVRNNERTSLAQIVDQVREKVLHRDKAVQPANYGKFSAGSHLEPHLLDAMRRLVSAETWKINERKARLWYSRDGLFLVWRMAAKEIIEELHSSSIAGIPQDAQTLLEILLGAKVFVKDKDGSPYWMIMPPNEKSELAAVKFADPMTLLGTMVDEVKPVDSLDGGAIESAKTEPQQAQETLRVADEQNAPGNLSQEGKGSSAVVEAPQTSTTIPAVADAPKEPVILGSALPEVKEEKKGAKLPSTIAALLRPATREVMSEVLTEHLAHQNKAHAGTVDQGYAISLEYLAGFGVDLDSILKSLHEIGWLYTPPEKPGKKVHHVALNNRKLNVIIIKTEQARDAGFIA